VTKNLNVLIRKPRGLTRDKPVPGLSQFDKRRPQFSITGTKD